MTLTAFGLVFLLIFGTGYFMYSFGFTVTGAPKLVFRPVNLFCIQFAAFFIAPIIVVFVMAAQIPGLPYMSSVYANIVIKVIFALIVFLFVVCGTFTLFTFFSLKALHRRVIEKPTGDELAIAAVLFVVGTAACVYIGHNYTEGPRSALVKTNEGAFLYGLTFMQTAGFLIIALHLAIERKYSLLVCFSLVFAYPLFLLGGRGRVLWPFVALMCSYMAFSGRMVSRFYIVGGFAFLIVAIVVMDPLLSWIRFGRAMTSTSFGSVIYDMYLVKRNFDAFYNFSVIVYYDAVPHSARYLISGIRDVFMNAYFPDVYARGFGYTATVPGTMWLVLGFPGLVVGSVVFGLLLVVLERLYFGARSSAAFCLVFYVSTNIADPGSALTEQIGKMVACAIAFSPYFIVSALNRTRVRRLQSAHTFPP